MRTATEVAVQSLPRCPFAATALCIVALALAPAVARGQVVITIVGDSADAVITLPGPGNTTYQADFEIDFEFPQNLTEACLGLSADVLDAGEIADITARFPDPAGYAIDAAFPVRVRVDPPAACGLEFRNDLKLKFRAENLVYAAGSPYRLLKAPSGGAFTDITAQVSAGSVRTRGSGGSFSEFVIARDLVIDYAADAVAQYATLAARLDDPAISTTVQRVLELDVAASRAAYEAGDYIAAADYLGQFDGRCRGFDDDAVPDRWRAARDLVDARGELLAIAAALRFSLESLAQGD